MTEESFDPDRLPPVEAQEPDVSRADLTLGTATYEDFTAADTAPVEDRSTEALLEALESDSAPERRRAILALGERDPESEVLDRLEALSHEDPDQEVRQFAIETIGRLDGDLEVVRDGLADENPWVRAEALVWLKKRAADRHVDTFEAALSDPHPAVRRNALVSLHHVRGADCRSELEAGLADESDRVREWAVTLLGKLDDPDTEELIADHLETEDSQIVREAAMRTLDDSVDVQTPTGGSGHARADSHVLNRGP